MKVWGDKTLKDNKSCLNNINARAIILKIQDTVGEYLESFIFEKVEDVNEKGFVKYGIDKYLQTLEDRKIIQSGKSYTHMYRKTWKMLYPHLYKRVLAKVGSFLIRKLHFFRFEESKPCIWHHIFPYKIRMYVDAHEWKMKCDWYRYKNTSDEGNDDLWEDIEDFWDFENVAMDWYVIWLENNPPEVVYKAELIIPYNYLGVELFVQPIKAIEKVAMTFNIERK